MDLFIRIINILFLHSKLKFYLMFILLFFAAIIESIGIGLVLPIVDIINTETNTVKISNIVFEKKEILIYIFLFFIFKFLLLIGIYFLQSKYVYDIQAFFSKLLFKKYLSLSLVKQKQKNTNVISRNIYNEVNEFAQISNILISTINEIVILLGIFILFILFLPNQIILTSLLLFIISIFFIKFLSNAIKQIGSKRQEFDGKRLIVINEAFKGIKEIISFGIKNIFIDKYSSHNFRSAQESSKMLFLKHIPRISIEFIVVILFLIFISLNLNDEILNGEKIFPIIALVGVSMLRMLPSINKIIVGANQINYGKAIIQVIEEAIKNKDRKNSIKLKKFTENFKSIKFENVNFSYDEKKIINNLNLKINLGDKIGIMGKSGSGKTTIIDLLMGMLKPDSGCIYINKEEINNLDLENSDLFSYIPQKSFVLDDNIKNNITFGKSGDKVDIDYYNLILKNACLEEFLEIEKSKDLLGDSGGKLSGGQIQRITIARALFRRSKILIMDEATSSLDKTTRDKILSNIKENFQNLTMIIVSHDEEVFSICDKIYKLKDGKVELI